MKKKILLIPLALLLAMSLVATGCPAPVAEEPVVEEPVVEEPAPGPATAVHFSELKAFLPDPPSGWVGEKPGGMTMTFDEWTWSIADRRYSKPGTYSDVSIEIIDGAYLLVGPWMMWGMFFEYEDAGGYLKSTSFKGYPAWEEHFKPDDYTLHVGINDRFMVSISVYDGDRDTLYAFADRIDYRGIAALD